MAAELATAVRTLSDVLEELDREGYTLEATTRLVILEHRLGSNFVRYADKLRVCPTPTPVLQEEIRRHRDILLAAACVLEPPVEWLRYLVGRVRDGKVQVRCLAANVAAFMEKDPIENAPSL